MSDDVRKLGELVAALMKEVSDLKSQGVGLGYSSFDRGGITQYQPGSSLPASRFGEQFDGTNGVVVLAGPTPPQPSAPSAAGGVERLLVRWDGTFAGDALTPQDWVRAEVHASETNNPGVLFETLRTTIESPRGGEVSITGLTPDTDYYVWLVARSASGKFSAPSQVVGPVRVTKLSVEDIDLSQIGGNTIWPGSPTTPTGEHKVGDLWLKEVAAGPPPQYVTMQWQGDTKGWVELQQQKVTKALQDVLAAQQTADGANTAALGAQTAAQAAANVAAGKTTNFPPSATAPPTTGRVVGDSYTNSAQGNLRYVWSGTAWVAAPIGSGAIQPKSLVASDVIATGTVSAALLEAVMLLATTIILGDQNGIHTRLSPTGMRVFDADGADADTAADEVARFGTATGDIFAIVKDGTLIGAVDRAANFTGNAGNFQALTVATPDHTGRGGSLLEIMDRRGRGLVGWNSDNGTFDSNTAAGRGTFDVSAKLYYGRMYKIAVRCRLNATTNDSLAEVQFRWTSSADGGPTVFPAPPVAPTINSPIAGRFQTAVSQPAAQGVYFEKMFSFGPGDPEAYRNARFLLCLSRPVGSATLTMYGAGDDNIEMWIEDVGPYMPVAGTRNDGGGTVSNPGPPPAPEAQRFSRSWVCTWHENYRPNGSAIALPGASQGHDPVNGNMRSYLGFSGAALDGSGVGLGDIVGSVIESVSVYLYSWHWGINDGGPAEIGMHGFVNPPGSFGGGNERMVGNQWMTKPGAKWIDLSPAGYGNWANGVWRGIMLGASAGIDDQRHYGRFTDETDVNNKPVLAVTYRK